MHSESITLKVIFENHHMSLFSRSYDSPLSKNRHHLSVLCQVPYFLAMLTSLPSSILHLVVSIPIVFPYPEKLTLLQSNLLLCLKQNLPFLKHSQLCPGPNSTPSPLHTLVHDPLNKCLWYRRKINIC